MNGRPPDGRLDGGERIAQWLLDEHPPAGRVDRLERAQYLRPLGITPVGDSPVGGREAGQGGTHLRQSGEVRVGEHEADVRGVGDDLAASVDRVGVAGGADLRPADRVDDGPEVDVRDDDALAGRRLGHRDARVWPAIGLVESDVTDVQRLGPCSPERFTVGAVDITGEAVDLVDLLGVRMHARRAGRIEVRQRADRRLTQEQVPE